MAGITTAFCSSAKSEFFLGAHCFSAGPVITASSTSSTSYTAASSLANITVGMPFTGTNVGAGSVVAKITSATAFTSSVASTGSISGGTLTFTGDVFMVALFKAGVAGTYGAASVNYTDMGADELPTAGGYTAGGMALVNVGPVLSGTTSYVNFSPNPSWTSATFSSDGGMIYNQSVRLGGTSGTNTTGGGRAVGVFSFGSTQTIAAGTFTILMPAASSSTAIFRLA